MRRRSRSLSPEKVYQLEQPKVSWRNVAGQFLTLEHNVAKAQARLQDFGELVTAHKNRLTGDEASLSVDQVFHIAKEFRADAREYTASLEEVLDCLERGNIAMSTALDEEDCRVDAVAAAGASSEDEQLRRQRAHLSSLVVHHWLRFRESHTAAYVLPVSPESSSSHSDLGSSTGREKAKQKVGWFKPMKMKSMDRTPVSQGGEADEESGAVTSDQDGLLGLTDESRGAPDGRTTSSGNGGAGVTSSGDGGEESSSGNWRTSGSASGDGGPGGCASGDDGTGTEEPADQVCEDVSPSKTSESQYRSGASTSFQSFYSATSGDEADCEPEVTTTPAASSITDLRNVDGNGNGNGNRIDNDNIDGSGNRSGARNATGMQTTAAQTDESWIAWDSVELGEFDKQSTWSVLHELCRQQSLLRLVLQHHMERLEQLRRSRMHLLSHTHPLRASWLLREQLTSMLRWVVAEVVATQHSLCLRASALCKFADAVWQGRPMIPPPQETIHQQLLARAAETAAAAAATPNKQPLGNMMRRAFHFLRCFTNRH